MLLGCTSNRFELANARDRETAEDLYASVPTRVPARPGLPVSPQDPTLPAVPAVPIVPGEPGMPVVSAPAGPADPGLGAWGTPDPAPSVAWGSGPLGRPESPRPGPPGSQLVPLTQGPELLGRVVTPQGQPAGLASVEARDLGRGRAVVAETATDRNGRFRIVNLRPGVQYELIASSSDVGIPLSGRTIVVPPNASIVLQMVADVVPQTGQLEPGLRGRGGRSPGWRDGEPFDFEQDFGGNGGPLRTGPEIARLAQDRPASPSAPVPAQLASKRDVPGFETARGYPAVTPIRTRPAFHAAGLDEVRLLDARSGQPFRLGDLEGEVFLFDWFGSWCLPCRRAKPEIDRIAKEYEGRLTVVAVACEEGSANEALQSAQRAIRDWAIGYRVLCSPLQQSCPARKHLRIEAFPTFLVMDREGRVLFRGSGTDAATMARLRSALASVIGEPPLF